MDKKKTIILGALIGYSVVRSLYKMQEAKQRREEMELVTKTVDSVMSDFEKHNKERFRQWNKEL